MVYMYILLTVTLAIIHQRVRVLIMHTHTQEEEGVWEWERVFVEMSSDIKRVWGSRESANCSQQETAKEELTP